MTSPFVPVPGNTPPALDSPTSRERGATQPQEELQALRLRLQTLERSSQQAHERAEQCLKALQKERELRDNFISALAHDLRTPLHAARLSAEVLVRSQDPDTLAKMSRRVVTNIKRADGILRDLLDANRLRAGQALPLALRPCRLGDIADAAALATQEAHSARPLVQHPALPLEGQWDDKNLQRAVEHLAANAVKYGTRNAPVTLSLARHGDWAELSVHNHGNPIPLQQQKALLPSYHRAGVAVPPQRSGTGWGVGLVLAKGIAEAHGGTLQLSSSAEVGTTFTLRLPLEAEATTERG